MRQAHVARQIQMTTDVRHNVFYRFQKCSSWRRQWRTSRLSWSSAAGMVIVSKEFKIGVEKQN
jgi:hypothetical protein